MIYNDVSLIIRGLCLKTLGKHKGVLSQVWESRLHTGPTFEHRNNANDEDATDGKNNFIKFASLIGIGASLSVWLRQKYTAEAQQDLNVISVETEAYGKYVDGLPVHSSEEVAKHNSLETGVWISFRHGVYNITDFIKEHPGGDKIMLGAGASVEPFWALYAVHKNPHVLDLMEKYRIGNLSADDVGAEIRDMDDPYCREPRRHALLKPSMKQPFNAEPPLTLLVESLHTPNEMFYVRNHLPVPSVDPKEYELEIEGLGLEEKTLSLEDIKKFPKHTITAAIQCGGNRRSEMTKVKAVKGLSWGQAAISNADWSGARLSDVLKAAGLDPSTEAQHVQFEGLDLDPTGHPFGASIRIEKALSPSGDVLLAYEMNGSPIPRDHGYPLRVVVPGVVGARNVKWLGRIIVSRHESQSHWQQNDYKGFAPNVDWDTVDFSKSPAIQEMPVTSAICDPAEGDHVRVKDGVVEVRGYAYSGGGRKIVRVDVSIDGGQNWREADELVTNDTKHDRAWGWTLWKARIPVPEDRKGLQIVAKAVDTSYNTQPESFENIWNLRGVLSNAYHRVNVEVKK